MRYCWAFSFPRDACAVSRMLFVVVRKCGVFLLFLTCVFNCLSCWLVILSMLVSIVWKSSPEKKSFISFMLIIKRSKDAQL